MLHLLKDDSIRDPVRQTEIEKLLGQKMASERFNKLVNLGKAVTDYATGGDDGGDASDDENEKLDEEMGVAVVFDDDEEDDEESDVDEVRSDEEEDDDAHGGVEADKERKLITGADSDGEDDDDEDAFALNVHEIDAHWLQRGLSKFYDDANISAKLADDIIAILGKDGGEDRECENKLMMLLDFTKFDFIKVWHVQISHSNTTRTTPRARVGGGARTTTTAPRDDARAPRRRRCDCTRSRPPCFQVLLRNRAKVLYCTRLKQAQTDDERKAIEASDTRCSYVPAQSGWGGSGHISACRGRTDPPPGSCLHWDSP